MSIKRLKVGAYETWIQVEGQDVEHYQVEVDETQKLVTCWIASSQGQKFSVLACKAPTIFDNGSRILLDGQNAGGSTFPANDTRQVKKDSLITGPQSAKPFTFGALKVSDDDSLLANPSAAQAIGEIRVEFHRISNVQNSRGTFSIPKTHDVHERAKKATPHRVEYGKEVHLTKSHTFVSCTYHEKVAQFVFRYTSLEMLRATGIAPPNPSLQEGPSRSQDQPNCVSKPAKRKAVKREEDSDSDLDDDEKENKKQEAELKAQLERLQKARKEKHVKKKAKRELKPVLLSGEVIDLTI